LEFEKTQNMKVVDHGKIFPKCPRTSKSMKASYVFEIGTKGSMKLDFSKFKHQIIGHFLISSSRSFLALPT
jgi:hypothetical protein